MDYETLRLIWWALLGILLIGFAIMDGFDLGTAFLSPFLGKTDLERRVILNTVGPVWEGNQVWFILGGGAIFAAWPPLYAASFSGFYLAMFLVLLTLILRPGGFKYRSKVEDRRWRMFWDWALFAGGLVPALVFGVAFGNLFRGVPFSYDSSLRFHSDITLIGLLNPFSLLVGIVSLSMIAMHGASWLNLKTEGVIQARARAVMPWLATVYAVTFIGAGAWLTQIDGLKITSAFAPNGPSNPLLKTVGESVGGWYANYAAHPVLWIAPILAIAAASFACLMRKRPLTAFLGSALVPAATIATAGAALFPFLMTSSTHPGASLTVWDASSSKLTLEIMLIATVLLLPIVLSYTAWVYRVLRGPVRAEDITSNSKTAY